MHYNTTQHNTTQHNTCGQRQAEFKAEHLPEIHAIRTKYEKALERAAEVSPPPLPSVAASLMSPHPMCAVQHTRNLGDKFKQDYKVSGRSCACVGERMVAVSAPRLGYRTQTTDTVQRIERDNDEKFAQMKKNYDARVESLKVCPRDATLMDAVLMPACRFASCQARAAR